MEKSALSFAWPSMKNNIECVAGPRHFQQQILDIAIVQVIDHGVAIASRSDE